MDEEKRKAFIEEYGVLREKYKMDFMSIPQFIPTERGTWELVIIPQITSTEQEPVKSPFIAPWIFSKDLATSGN